MRFRSWGRLGRALVAFGLVVAACGDDDEGSKGPPDASLDAENAGASADSAGTSGRSSGGSTGQPGDGGNGLDEAGLDGKGGQASTGGTDAGGDTGGGTRADDSGNPDVSAGMDASNHRDVSAGMDATDGKPSDSPSAEAALPDPSDIVAAGVRWVGRVDLTDAERPRFAWSGAGFVAAFVGTGLSVRMNHTDAFVFRAVIDGNARPLRAVQAGESVYSLASNLPQGRHVVAFYRQTEGQQGDSQLLDVIVTGGTVVSPPRSPGRRIEVVGDSISTGYGNLGRNPSCGYTYGTQSHWDTYGAVAARHLGAELSTIAVSGIGMVRNGDGSTEGTLPQIYDRVLTNSPTPSWNFEAQPDAVVVNLGTNDFALGDPDNPFREAYLAFVEVVREKYPEAYILCTIGPMISDNFPEGQEQLTKFRSHVQAVVSARQAAGDDRVGFLEFSEQVDEDFACDYHPNVVKHQSMGDALALKLKAELGW